MLETEGIAETCSWDRRFSNERAIRISKLEFSCWTRIASLCRITEETMDSMLSAVIGISSMNSSSSDLSSGGGVRNILTER